MADMNELVLEHLMTEVQEHITTKSMLSSALRERDRLDDQCVALSNQIDTLGKKLIDATAGQELEHKLAHDWLIENTSLKAELTRLVDQHQKTVNVLKDLANTIEAKFRGRKGQNMSPAFYAARSHLKLIEPL